MTATSTTTRTEGAAARRGGRAVRVLSGLVVLGLAGGAVAAATAAPAPRAPDVPPVAVAVDAGRTTLVCPGPLRLPDEDGAGDSEFDRVPVAPVEQVTAFDAALSGSATLTPLGGDATSFDAGAAALSSPAAPVVLRADPVEGEPARVAGVTSSRVTDGDLRGLAAGSCARPASDLWLVGGSTSLESTADLVVVNPGATPAEVAVELWGPSGPVDLGAGATTLVAPGEQRVVVLPGVAAEQRRIAVHLSAAGGQVSAYLQDSLLDGFTPRGTDLVTPGTSPGTTQLVPGIRVPAADVDDPEAAVLRLLAPADGGATAAVRLLGPDGDVVLPGAERLELAAGEVTDLSLGGLPAGTYTAVVEADAPVVASASLAREGDAGELDEQPRLDRAWSASSRAGGGLVAVPAGTDGYVTLGAVPTGDVGDGDAGPRPTAAPSPEPTQGQRPDPGADDDAPTGPVTTVTLRAYGADGVVAEQDVEVPVGSTVSVPVEDLAEDVVGVEVLPADDPAADIAWALVAMVERADGTLLSVVSPLTDSEAVTQAQVREGRRVGLD
ncbi:DUF5719 family protein [Cellulomonas sp. C5510]|uniref:DUF5719 family protein n=1 Tax=Cellulomonas sp. C5510 TaxID=2871170 RepID=UPI001C95EC21|nr:DUF5719 family protein [Cellulomonas sp. C5510]QZN84767.1 hypothetical protein K5O09_13160 [Cellulomonas sp. C5510]